MEKGFEMFERFLGFIRYYVLVIGSTIIGVVVLTFIVYPMLVVFVIGGIIKMLLMSVWDAIGNKWFRYTVEQFKMLSRTTKALCEIKGRREFCKKQLARK